MRLSVKSVAAIAVGAVGFLGALGSAIAFYDDYRPWPKRQHLQLVAERAYSLSLKDAKAWVLELELALAKCEEAEAKCSSGQRAVLIRSLREASNDILEIEDEQKRIK
ncbi:MAG: hypothetical protein ACR2QC_04035 [Gammaproteobacteria bacterium]